MQCTQLQLLTTLIKKKKKYMDLPFTMCSFCQAQKFNLEAETGDDSQGVSQHSRNGSQGDNSGVRRLYDCWLAFCPTGK